MGAVCKREYVQGYIVLHFIFIDQNTATVLRWHQIRKWMEDFSPIYAATVDV